MWSTSYYYQILWKLQLALQILKKFSNMKFHENLSSGVELFYADGRTDRRTDIHNEANSLFSLFF